MIFNHRTVSLLSVAIVSALGLVACKLSSTSGQSDMSNVDSANGGAMWRPTDTTYFPYPGPGCDPFAGDCAGGDFDVNKVRAEYLANKNGAQFPGGMAGKIPAWGPHTFHCTEFRASDSQSFKDISNGGPAHFRYYVGVSPQIGANCGDVIRVNLAGKQYRYMVTDVCPAHHAVQGYQKHCDKPNLDISLYGIKEQLGQLNNTQGQAQFYVECRGNCGYLPLGKVQ